ncbi:MAG: prolyl oligopeptidase family serine peptidase, partial [Verrucomicrobiales bacterium]|nr:prolyl oligopeptidase family serine peptidase [Verrucomicrobiales bacterium]
PPLPRLPTTAHLYTANPKTGRSRRFFTDKSETWFDDRFNTTWLGDDDSELLWLTDHDGWHRPLKVSRDGKTVTPLTTPPADITAVLGHSDTDVYLATSPDNPTQRYLYATTLDGTKLRRITPPQFTGSNSYSISPDGTHAIHRHSTFDLPTTTTLIKLPSHERIRVIEDNTGLNEKLNALARPQTDFLRIPVNDDELDAYRLLPPDFDPTKKYPSIVHVYGEPAGQTVRDSWGGKTHLWHHYMAQQGYIIYSIDNRGTNSPRGVQFRKSVYKQIGILAPQDQAAAVKHLLANNSYLDPDRVGVWGHSGGGSMTLNAMFRYPDLYSAGVAIAFIADQRLYDTIYQERYMGVPPDNEQNYIDGSPITHAEHLKGDLLLIYGTGDDNCHYQNCERLINKLVEHNKPFELLSYPNRTHSIKERKNTLLHRFNATTNFFNRTLK